MPQPGGLSYPRLVDLKEETMRTAALAILIVVPSTAFAAEMDMTAGKEAVKWAPAPSALPKGAKLAVLSGDPSADGPYVVRLQMPAGYQIPAHHHPTAENVTVMSGSLHAGMGDKLDKSKAQAFTSGGFISMPAKMNHYAWTTSATVIQVHGVGPFAIEYVIPADDPGKAK
jgi:anti-sigma factor ChrR (cupin superfamily)